MSGHADTIQGLGEELSNAVCARNDSVAAERLAALNALLAENQRYEKALANLEREFLARGGLAASPEDVAMYLRIAREALAGATE